MTETGTSFGPSDFENAVLGDERRSKRACDLVGALMQNPGLCFAQAFKSVAQREAGYRFVNNQAVTYEALVDAHAESTVLRANTEEVILVIHDSSESRHDDSVDGVGYLRGKQRGFLGHYALAATAHGERRPLGVLGFIPVVRSGIPRGPTTTQKLAKLRPEDKESRRWPDLVDIVEGKIAGHVSAIHVADREGDSYPFLSHLVDRGCRFVIRLCRDRRVEEMTGDFNTLHESMKSPELVVTCDVPLGHRPAQYRENGLLKKPARSERTACLAISARRLQLLQPRHWRGATLPSLPVNVVWVREQSPPPGAEPVDWMIVTTEPIETPQDLEQIVDFYRRRWLIEEFFKAIKTGCQFEKRGLESLEALLVTLALLLPVACHLLELRTLARSTPHRPATEVMSPMRLTVLRAILKDHVLTDNPTVQDAMLAVAALGCHIKNNGRPGWIVLGRGMEELLRAEAVWLAALEFSKRCDQ